MTEIPKERRESLRAEVFEMGDSRVLGDMGERVTLGDLRALLDAADERDRLRSSMEMILNCPVIRTEWAKDVAREALNGSQS